MASAGRNLAKLIGANQQVKLTGSGGDSDFNAALDSDATKLATLEREIKSRLDSDEANPITASTLNMGSNDVVTTGKMYFANMFSTEGDLPSASTYHGMFAHVHATGAAYFAHDGSWVKLANNSDIAGGGFDSDQIVSIINENPIAADSDSGGGGGSTISVEMLVVAGGGGGGYQVGGGGGAGGYRTSTQSVAQNITLTVTVGAGGAAGYGTPTGNQLGLNGSASSISGVGVTTISSAGGGGGGGHAAGARQGSDGGSGGGHGSKYAFTASSGNVPSVTPSQGNDGGLTNTVSTYNAGGGGGAGAAGADGNTPASGGEGGVGVANTITGSSVYYAGGGSGTIENNRSGTGYNPGGLGGGGNGDSYNSSSGTVGSSGTVNTGGGAGGARTSNPAFSGGSGVVILKVFTSSYTGTTSGSPTVTTSGDYTIIKFTSSGSYTV